MCEGPCSAGYFCVAGSVSGFAAPCGNTTVYCRAGAVASAAVAAGHFGVGGGADGMTRTDEEQCSVGYWFAGGVMRPCPSGVFGDAKLLTSEACSGVCSGGYTCPPGSVTPKALACPMGSYCAGGLTTPCPVGRYNAVTGIMSAQECTLCPADSFGPQVGAVSLGACYPCGSYERSGPGSALCWPGLLSVVASSPPPLVPGVSPGDVVTFTFSKPTNTPLGVVHYLNFSTALGNLVGEWNAAGTVLTVAIRQVSPALVASASVIGVLTVTLLPAGGVRDAAGTSQEAQFSGELVTGDWGFAVTPDFMAPDGAYASAFARNTGGQAGLGVGDSLVLRFNNLCRQVRIDTTADIDALFEFSARIGTEYSGAWDVAGPLAYASLTIVVTAAEEAADPGGTAVGGLIVSVRPSGGLTSLDESTPPSSAWILVSLGSWGDLPLVSVIQVGRARGGGGVLWVPSCAESVLQATPRVMRVFAECNLGGRVAAFCMAFRVRWSTSASFERVLGEANETAVGGSFAALYVDNLAVGQYVFLRVSMVLSLQFGGELLAPPGELGPERALEDPVWTEAPFVSRIGDGLTDPFDLFLVLPAAGGSRVFLSGGYLGLHGTRVNASYGNTEFTNEGRVYNASSCFVLVEHAIVECTTAAGVGVDFRWSVDVDGVPALMSILLGGGDFTAYRPPQVSGAQWAVNAGGIDIFVLTGREFGPVDVLLPVKSVDYAYLYAPTFAEVIFFSPGCNVTAHDTEISCFAPIGQGRDLSWQVSVGHQNIAVRRLEYPLPVVNFSSIVCAPLACDAWSTLGGSKVTIGGSYFGPVSGPDFSLVSGKYGSVEALGMYPVQFVDCVVEVADVRIVCTVPPGTGAFWGLRVTALEQQSSHVVGPAFKFGYAPPVISRVQVSSASGDLIIGGLGVVANDVTVFGANLGTGRLDLFLNDTLVSVEEVSLSPQGDDFLRFNLGLPTALVGYSVLSFRLALNDQTSNALALSAAPPSLLRDPFSVIEGTHVDTPACSGLTASYWVTLKGYNFGESEAAVALSCDVAVCVMCFSVDFGGSSVAEILFATNMSLGFVSIGRAVGDFAPVSALFDADRLLAVPTILDIFTWGADSLTPAATTGGDIVRISGTGFYAGMRVLLVRDPWARTVFVTPEGAVGGLSARSGDAEVTIERLLTAELVDVVVPPGTGASFGFVLFARRVLVFGDTWLLTYAAPHVSRVVVEGGQGTLLSRSGGYLRIEGGGFGRQLDALSVLIGTGISMAVCNVSAVNDTEIRCLAPPCSAFAPDILLEVRGRAATGATGLLHCAPPRVDSVSPEASPTLGGLHMTVAGAEFGSDPGVVMFDLLSGLVRAVVVRWTDRRVDVVIPPGFSGGSLSSNGSVAIRVSNGPGKVDGEGELQWATVDGLFSYDPPVVLRAAAVLVGPTAKRAAASSGACPAIGCHVRVLGKNFGAFNAGCDGAPPVVSIGGRACRLLNWTHSELTCDLPGGTGSRHVLSVALAGREAVMNGTFAYAAPVATALSPPDVDQRLVASFVVSGDNFGAAGLAITVAGAACAPARFLNSSAVQCVSVRVAEVGLAAVVVTVDGQTSPPRALAAVCGPGYFGRPGDGPCAPCPPHAVCGGRAFEPTASAGFWRGGRTQFVACVPAAACVAGAAGSNESNCAPQYVGEECRACASGFYRRGLSCLPCPTNAAALVVVFVVAVVAVGALAAWLHRHMFNVKGLTIGLDMLQALSMFSAFKFGWPDPLQSMFSAASLSTFSIELVAPEVRVEAFQFWCI